MRKNKAEFRRLARVVLGSDPDYIYDPEHRNRPKGGDWHKTDKGWSKAEVSKSSETSTNELENKSKNTRENIASDKNTPVNVLEKLSTDKDEWVRRCVALNTSTPTSVLERLSADEDDDVRRGVAENENTPAEVLAKLSTDSFTVRCGVASNVNTPVDILEKLSKDEEKDVRWSVAYNASTPVDMLRAIIFEDPPYARHFPRNRSI